MSFFCTMKGRLLFFSILTGLFVLVWIIYLFILQVFDPHNLEATINIRTHPSKRIEIPHRGDILDCHGKMLVSSIKLFQLDFDRNQLYTACKADSNRSLTQELNSVASVIASHTDLSASTLRRKLQKKPRTTSIFIAENIPENQINAINDELDARDIPGLMKTFCNMKRTYPQDRLASRLLGMVRKTTTDDEFAEESIYRLKGMCGLEATFDNELTGIYGWQEAIYDANNNRIPHLDLRKREAQDGHALYLTIDSNYQEILEENLQKGLKKYRARHGLGIIMDCHNGAIKAMAGFAREDTHKDASALRAMANLPVSFMFEPGSVMKPFVALLALERDIYKPSDIIDCRPYVMPERTITDDEHNFAKLSFRDIIAHSSNVGISKIVEQVGSKGLYECLITLGFGHKTGSNIAGEAPGIFRKLKDWQGFSLHSISFGQEISVTALQLANAYCAIANGGNLMLPYIVQDIKTSDGLLVEHQQPKILRTISDPQSLDTLRVFLKNVVDYGTATNAKLNFVTTAGKTGTAEKIIEGETEYSKTKYTSVFAGFFPVEEPQYVIVIAYDEANFNDYSYYASHSAVPTFRDVVVDMVNLSSSGIIAAARSNSSTYIEMPDLMGMQSEKARKQLLKKNINPQFIEKKAGGVVINQFPKAGVSFDPSNPVCVIIGKAAPTNDPPLQADTMPSLEGLSLRRAITLARKLNLTLHVSGHGVIYWQSITAGNAVEYGDICTVKAR